MKNEGWLWAVAGVSAIGLGLLLALGASGAGVLLLAILGTLLMAGVATFLKRPVDAAWLTKWVTLGFVAKIVGAYARHFMVENVYGSGDSIAYYNAGTTLATTWRSGTVPPLSGSGSLGTQVVEAFTGGLFAIFTPDMLGGFVMFSMLSFLGQLGFYAAFRRWAKPHQLKPYALLVLFFPTYAFWPSSIGKDALVILCLGSAAYFISRLLESFELRWILPLGLALTGLGLIRIHIAALVALALVGALLVSKLKIGAGFIARGRKFLTFFGAAAAVVLAVTLIPDIVGLQLGDLEDLTPFTTEITRRTSEDGTVAAGNPVRAIADVPGAVALVLFRPFIFEATELQHYLAAAETTLILLLFAWKLPAMLRNWREWRNNAYLVFCTLYTLAFAVAFSVVRNLGIIARQRGQVLAFFLALVIGLGWNEKRKVTRARIPVQPVSLEPELTGTAVDR
ncbi:MAG: DUF3292 domain-containing protein [Actinomycetota bacterium]|nr:DUF3292 domain-containing protein [Actinomycetota bacterium]